MIKKETNEVTTNEVDLDYKKMLELQVRIGFHVNPVNSPFFLLNYYHGVAEGHNELYVRSRGALLLFHELLKEYFWYSTNRERPERS
jgi:hypothetical protein